MSELPPWPTPAVSLPAPRSVPVPPTRFVFPAWGAPPLPPLTPVTVGGPGWWLVDELLVVDGPHGPEGEEFYRVLPAPEYGAALASGGSPEPERIGVGDLYVYLDGLPGMVRTDELFQPGPLAWMDRVTRSPSSEPPQRQEPVPARWLPSMTGKTMRLGTADHATGEVDWTWVKGLSEGLNDDGEINVSVCALPDYWRAAYRRPGPNWTWIRRVSIHRLWAY